MALLDSMNLRRSSAHSLRASKQTVEQQDADRVCDQPGCRTALSRYNPAASCTLHEGWSDPPTGARRRAHDAQG